MLNFASEELEHAFGGECVPQGYGNSLLSVAGEGGVAYTGTSHFCESATSVSMLADLADIRLTEYPLDSFDDVQSKRRTFRERRAR